MKEVTGIFIFIFLMVFSSGNCLDMSRLYSPQPDSIPPPPGNNIILTGPVEACLGDISIYFTDVPVACTCQWSLNGVIQPGTGNQLEIAWTQAGLHIVELDFICENGQSSSAGTIETEVSEIPVVDLGPDTTISQGQSIVLDAGNTGSNYEWSTGDTTQTIEVSQAGTYSVAVTNYCGIDWDDIEVSVISGMEEDHQAFNGNVYFFGGSIRIVLQGEKVSYIKIVDSSGRTLYDGKSIETYNPQQKGLLIIVLYAEKGVYSYKVVAK
jgi:hypothetical protein